VLGLTKSMVHELSPIHGIRINAILPGLVDTDMIR
jgi:NAD(P)-dependent dehydrogenase (short-subunit alcohol dehydrogenase family)